MLGCSQRMKALVSVIFCVNAIKMNLFFCAICCDENKFHNTHWSSFEFFISTDSPFVLAFSLINPVMLCWSEAERIEIWTIVGHDEQRPQPTFDSFLRTIKEIRETDVMNAVETYRARAPIKYL
jgi:hypothetical protein